MEQPRLRLSWIKKLSFSSAHFLNVLGWAMWSTYGISFFTKVLQLPHSIGGDIVLVAQISGAVSLPLLGILSDRTRLRYGRRKIFILAGVIAIACSFFFLWYECINCSSAAAKYQAIYFAFFGIVFVVGWAAIGLPQLALIPELSPDTHTTIQLNALRYIVLLLQTPALLNCTSVCNSMEYYRVDLIMSIFAIIFSLPFRNVFTYLASIIVLACFWVLLEHLDTGESLNALGPADKKVFWVRSHWLFQYNYSGHPSITDSSIITDKFQGPDCFPLT